MKKTLNNLFCLNDFFYVIRGDGIPSSFVVKYNYKNNLNDLKHYIIINIV